MNPNRVDFIIDLVYGVLLFAAVVLILTVGTSLGIAFGLGVLVSYIVHVVWKMARFDPAWMTQEITESIEETVTEEVTETVGEQVTETVGEQVTEEVTETVGEQVTEEVTETVGEQVAEQVTETVEEQVTEEVTKSVEEQVTEEVTAEVTENVEATLSKELDTIIAQLEAVNERIDRQEDTAAADAAEDDG